MLLAEASVKHVDQAVGSLTHHLTDHGLCLSSGGSPPESSPSAQSRRLPAATWNLEHLLHATELPRLGAFAQLFEVLQEEAVLHLKGTKNKEAYAQPD